MNNDSSVNQEEVNLFLDELRDSGQINMFGAAPYVADMFGVTKQEARRFLTTWMETYSDRHK